MHTAKRNGALTLLLFSLAGSLVVAVAFVVALTLSLPPTDGAYGQAPFRDPLVFPVMCMGALVVGLLLYPFALWLLRRVDLFRSARVILPVALVSVVVPTVFRFPLAVPMALVATVGSMFFCRQRFAAPAEPASTSPPLRTDTFGVRSRAE